MGCSGAVRWRVGYPLVCNYIAAAERLRRQALSRRPSAAALLGLGLQMGATATIRNVAPHHVRRRCEAPERRC